MTKLIPSTKTGENVIKKPIPRPSNEFLDNILGVQFDVLDHGFVRVVDYMGSDTSVVQAARTSYGKGTKQISQDKGLIRYLLRHRHTSCFEMAEIKFHIKLPIFIARQWVRHRTACLSGDTQVTFDLPGGKNNSLYRSYKMSVKDIYDKFQATKNISRPDKQRNPYHKRDKVKGMLLRSCDEDNFSLYHTHINDIWECGEKEIIRVNFVNGGTLRASKDHLCLTEVGWLKLSDALEQNVRFATPKKNEGFISFPVNRSVADIKAEKWNIIEGYEDQDYWISSLGRIRKGNHIKQNTVSASGYELIGLSKHGETRTKLVHHLVLNAFNKKQPENSIARHLNNNRRDNNINNLMWGTYKENSEDRMQNGFDQRLIMGWTEVKDSCLDGIEMTYDIEVKGPYHNFVAGDVIVHNSLNEYSARYSLMEDEFYIPEAENLAIQSTDNKQGRGEVLTSEQAEHVRKILIEDSTRCYKDYVEMVDEEGDIKLARELARINLTLNSYTQWYWKIDLHNLLHFLTLRIDSHAQYEIRIYAEIIAEILKGWCPIVYDAWKDYRVNSLEISHQHVEMLKKALLFVASEKSELLDAPKGMSKREHMEFLVKLGLDSYLS